MARSLVEALSARGLVCVVGAGGKKSTIYRLAGMISRAVVTATVRIPHFDDQVTVVHVTDDPVAAVSQTVDWPIGVVARREATRYEGYDPAVVASL
ncbi:MAG: putative selenium-dependent hydroxylase accessory protein YqeC, partial [Halobacteriales archaeon]|nr:putative selenium-dependent hydroxylase accessory protein YqeC [Halobacteriales archaeon]